MLKKSNSKYNGENLLSRFRTSHKFTKLASNLQYISTNDALTSGMLKSVKMSTPTQ